MMFLEIAPYTRGRTKEEIMEWRKRDPIEIFKARLITEAVLTEAKVKELNNLVQKEIEDAVQFAEESPDPTPEAALKDVYLE
jgi:TPP-dependent pyruvate/acetoin dehydrogenase alpha subunit